MEVDELTRPEQVVLVALAKHLVAIDGQLSDSELFDLLRLGVAIGKETFAAALTEVEPYFRDADAVLARTDTVERPEARKRMWQELDRLARGDGLHADEAAFLQTLQARWRPEFASPPRTPGDG